MTFFQTLVITIITVGIPAISVVLGYVARKVDKSHDEIKKTSELVNGQRTEMVQHITDLNNKVAELMGYLGKQSGLIDALKKEVTELKGEL